MRLDFFFGVSEGLDGMKGGGSGSEDRELGNRKDFVFFFNKRLQENRRISDLSLVNTDDPEVKSN